MDNNAICTIGSNAHITLSNGVLMRNTDGTCMIEMQLSPTFISSQSVRSGNCLISPTFNGVAISCDVKGNDNISFMVDVELPFLNVRANDRSFALMKEKFTPLVVFSCIGSLDTAGNVIAPAKMEYQKITDKKYCIVLSSTSSFAQQILFEANLYENKLFQDTTVESMNPLLNNAFGSMAFIGNTALYNEQWLYSRLDYSKFPEIIDRQIYKVVLHMPKFNTSNVEICAFGLSARFCSFGSNWDNKAPVGAPVAVSLTENGYQSLDITSLLIDPLVRTITMSEGLILKSKIKGNGFSAVSTGDSYYAPQIMEVNFR